MTDKEAIKKLLEILKNYRRTIYSIILCLLLSTGVSLYMPIISSKIMDDGFIGLFILDYRLTFLVLLFLPVKYIVIKYFTKARKTYMDAYIINAQEYSGWFGDTISGVREVKLFGIFENKLNEFRTKKETVIDQERKMSMLGQWNNIVDSLLVQVMMAFIYIVGADLVFNMRLTVGNVFAFITYSTYVTSLISAILNIGYFFSGIIPSTKRYYQFMEYEEEYSAEENQCDSIEKWTYH